MSTEMGKGAGPYRPSFWRVLWTNALYSPRMNLGFMRLDFVLGTIFIIPFTEMVFFAFVASQAQNPGVPVSFVVVGNAVAAVTYSSVFSVCQTTDTEKNQGTMEHLLVAPSGRFPLYVGRGVVPVLVSLATCAMGIVYAVEIFHVPLPASEVPAVVVSVVLTALALVGFGLLLGGVALFLRTSIILGNVFLFLGLVVSGVNFPVSYLPWWAQDVGKAFPLTWGVAAVRATLEGQSLASVAPLWGWLVLSGVASYGLAMGLWGAFEQRALRTGSIVRF